MSDHIADWVQVAEVSDLWQGEIIVGRLRESGIDAQILDQTFHQEPLSNVRAFAVVRIFVPQEREEDAKRLISEGFALSDDVELIGGEEE